MKEPCTTESLLRLHCSVRVPSLASDAFRLTATKGVGTGESFRQFSVDDDSLLADCGYLTVRGSCTWSAVRVNTASQSLRTPEREPFDLLVKVSGLGLAGMIGSWRVQVVARKIVRWRGGLAFGWRPV